LVYGEDVLPNSQFNNPFAAVLHHVLQGICDDFNSQAFVPLCEGDLVAYAYSRLLSSGLPAKSLFREAILDSGGGYWDLVVGSVVGRGRIDPIGVAEFKFFGSKRGIYPQAYGLLLDDAKNLTSARKMSRVEVIGDFYFRALNGYLRGYSGTSQRETEVKQVFAPTGATVFWLRPDLGSRNMAVQILV
jgi:hypothetical protein